MDSTEGLQGSWVKEHISKNQSYDWVNRNYLQLKQWVFFLSLTVVTTCKLLTSRLWDEIAFYYYYFKVQNVNICIWSFQNIIHYVILLKLYLWFSCFRNEQIAAILDQKNYVEELNRQLK